VKNLFSILNNKPVKDEPVIIVSGLPRSGTSMMMKMIVEGGVQAITDGIREQDDDNPNGYFELETVKQLPHGQADWLNNANGKVIKVISSLLEYLPARYSYKVIFMERDINEVLESQKKMLANRNEDNPIEDEKMKKEFTDHLAAVKAWMVRQRNMDVLYIRFNELMVNPAPFCAKVVQFLDTSLNEQKMLDVPNNKLYRNRAEEIKV